MERLIHLIYTSTASRPFSPVDLSTLLQEARDSNERMGVTGMLLYSGETFFQVLEGAEPVVDALYTRIRTDARHHRAVAIVREPVARRTFGEWSMGYASLEEGDQEELAGMNDFFATGMCLSSLSAGRAKKLLSAFASGRWRARIQGTESRQHASVSR